MIGGKFMIKLITKLIALTAIGVAVRAKRCSNHLNTKNSIKDNVSIDNQGLKIEMGSKELRIAQT